MDNEKAAKFCAPMTKWIVEHYADQLEDTADLLQALHLTILMLAHTMVKICPEEKRQHLKNDILRCIYGHLEEIFPE